MGDNGMGETYAPNASGKTAQAINAGVDARYQALVEKAMGEGKTVPGFVRDQFVFTGGVSGTAAGPRYPLTKAELDARYGAKPESPLRATAGERVPSGDIVPVKQNHPLTKSEIDAMLKEHPTQAAPSKVKEPLPATETTGGNVKGRNLEAGSEVEKRTVEGASDEVPGGIKPEKDRFREGLLGEEGKGGGEAYDRFLEGLRGEAGKGGISGENILEKGEIVSDGTGYSFSSKLYTPVEYKGTVIVNGDIRDVSRRVYQRNDININYYDETIGLTNIERMQKNRPPIGADGNPIELHHILQEEPGSMVEIKEMTHQEYYSQLHGLVGKGESFRNDPILDKQYRNFMHNYWKWRANQILGGTKDAR